MATRRVVSLSLFSACFALLNVHSASAQSLADRDWAEREFRDVPSEMTKVVEPANSICGKNISYSFKQESFTKEYAGYSIAGNCGHVFEALAKLCETAVGKDSVAKKIEKVECHMEKGIRGAVTLSGSTIEFAQGTEGGGLGVDELKDRLMEKL